MPATYIPTPMSRKRATPSATAGSDPPWLARKKATKGASAVLNAVRIVPRTMYGVRW